MSNQLLVCTPCYGRDYKTFEAVRADWAAGKDFKIVGGPYINKQDADQHDVSVEVEFDQRTQRTRVR